ncbi:autophagy-related protein 13 homolog [Biomphalaria glabrata]|uniref:Autophagy-related protein 13 n=1 Tax=Biomphalaria glabrata TaxID=6526 RepID=A0A9W3B639_BIOGL|nr:autophagy-related protein 13 homolog [Biomphalaria glabrata]KAI8733918.1 autophagy-related protein 13 isoform X1 [Biomphalaria glabrata]
MAMANNSYYLEASVGKDDNFEKMFKNFTFKCLQVIIQSRMEIKNKRLLKEPSSADYFCITVADNAAIEEQIRKVLEGVKCFPVREQSICVEIPLVTNDGDHMFLETWDISFNLSSLDTTASKLQHVFTRMCVTLKSLLCATRAMPAYKLAKNQGEKGGGFKLNYRLYLGKPQTHFLGEGFKTVRAGAVPTAQGLFTINVSFRTKLLLSPAMSASALQAIEVTDNYFMKEYKTSSASSALSDPQPCSPSPRSPVNRSESPYCFAVSPGSIEKEEHELRARFPSESSPWTHSSILNLEELPEPVVGAFSKASHKKVIEHKVPFEGLMRRSMVARQESEKSKQSYDEWAIDGRRSSRPDSKEGEKENVPIDSQRGQKMSIEDEFVMVDKPPFAADDDPRDVKAFLGVFFRAPKTYETQECKVSVEEYLCDVEALVSKLEEDMPVLDEFCQSVINLNSQEEEDENPLFS